LIAVARTGGPIGAASGISTPKTTWKQRSCTSAMDRTEIDFEAIRLVSEGRVLHQPDASARERVLYQPDALARDRATLAYASGW
jgi:hypothetical protein